MEGTSPVYSLSICARLTLGLHSINNEGSEGNHEQTRMVDIIAPDSRLYNVNGISGDMFKHIQTEHLYKIARAREDLPLCQACRLFDANRINADSEYISQIAGKSDAEAINLLLNRCAMDDLEGALITASRSTPRKSIAEFSWVVGVPVDEQGLPLTATDSYFHIKLTPYNTAEARRNGKKDETPRKSNLGQIPFYRPASSGVYALVNHYEISRIGYNDVGQYYAIGQDQREVRYRALLESILFTFLQLNGAMRSTQMPHLIAMEGIICYTTGVIPAPTVSPLRPDYCEELNKIARVLNRLYPQKVGMLPFASLGQFAAQMQEMIELTSPFAINV